MRQLRTLTWLFLLVFLAPACKDRNVGSGLAGEETALAQAGEGRYKAAELPAAVLATIAQAIQAFLATNDDGSGTEFTFACSHNDLPVVYCSAAYATGGGALGGLAFSVNTQGKDFTVLAHKRD